MRALGTQTSKDKEETVLITGILNGLRFFLDRKDFVPLLPKGIF